jgi:prepilin-type processing-associated H-X9-DG protein
MPDPTIQCPNCGQPLSVRAAPGQLVQCPNCRQAFPAPATGFAPPPPPPVNYSGPGYVQSGPTSGIAMAALICGILFFFPLTALLAIIFGIIGLAKTNNPAVKGRGFAIAGLVLGSIGLVFSICSISILLPSLNRARETANRVKCGSNLRQIGQAMLLYANENRGAYPPRPEDLLLTQDIESIVFVCPSTNDTPAPGSSGPQQATKLTAGGHDSYVYLGKGLRNTAGFKTVLAYEPMSNHKNGMNVLFGDGHVEFLSGVMAQKVESELKAGQNPPPSYRGF